MKKTKPRKRVYLITEVTPKLRQAVLRAALVPDRGTIDLSSWLRRTIIAELVRTGFWPAT